MNIIEKRQWALLIRRPFQPLLEDMQVFLPKAEELFHQIRQQDPDHPEKFDKQLWEAEKAFARASFIMGMAGVEAFCNAVLADHKCHEKKDLPKEWLNRRQRERNLDMWRLVDKVKFIPTLCNTALKSPVEYFDMKCSEFGRFEELVEIRNSIMHGRITQHKNLITFDSRRRHIIDDDFPENYWKLSNIHRDFATFNYECAVKASEMISWVIKKVTEFLHGRINDRYFTDFEIKLEGKPFDAT